jgi:hypothetical protein
MATKKKSPATKATRKKISTPSKTEPKNWARRLIFEYDGSAVKLVSEQRLAMVAPPPQSLLSRPEERGFWIELRDAKNLPVYRRSIERPMEEDMEVLADDNLRPLRRVAVNKPKGTFFVVVPDLAVARQIVFRGDATRTAKEQKDQKAPAVEDLHRFDLRKIAKGS